MESLYSFVNISGYSMQSTKIFLLVMNLRIPCKELKPPYYFLFSGIGTKRIAKC